MAKRCSLILLAAVCCFAADKDFNGRWDITVNGEPRHRAWWLEVSGAESGHPQGKFVGAPGGQMDGIPEMAVKEGQLEFAFNRVYRNADPNQKRRGVYKARLLNGKLEGTHTVEGSAVKMTWVGVRAPQIRDKDDGSWKPGKPVALFDGKSLNGWRSSSSPQVEGWSVADGLLTNSKGARDLRSGPVFWNFKLQAEYRVGEKSNSGLGLRGRYEVQIFEDFGDPPSLHGNGALYSRIVPKVNASRKPNEWQSMDVTLIGRTVTVVVNGQKVIDKQEVEGLTAMATDPNEAEPGPITVQGDHGLVQFRKLVVTPLTQR